jgi:hypothetical protein
VTVLGVLAAATVAASPETVLLLLSHDTELGLLEERAAAELDAAGFAANPVSVALDPTADIPGQLWARCAAEHARAVLAFIPRGDGRVDVWVAVADSSKAVVRTWPAPTKYSERATLALKAVDLLHATLLEIGVLEAPDPDMPSQRVRFRQPWEPHWRFGTGLGAVFTYGGLRPQPLLELHLGYQFHPRLAIELQGATSVWPERAVALGLESEIGLAFLRVMGMWTFVRGSRVAFNLLFGTGALLMWMSGATSPDPVEPPSAEVRIGWLHTAGLGMSIDLIDRVRLQIFGTASLCFPQLTAEVAMQPIATVGQPLFDAIVRLDFE